MVCAWLKPAESNRAATIEKMHPARCRSLFIAIATFIAAILSVLNMYVLLFLPPQIVNEHTHPHHDSTMHVVEIQLDERSTRCWKKRGQRRIENVAYITALYE